MKKKTDILAAPQMPKPTLQEVELAYIIPSPSNPRKEFGEAELDELAESIRNLGILQPMLVHANDAGGFTLICGERRYRAAIKAGLDKVPCNVYPTLPEDLVFELQITENLQRKDINPVEECDAFTELIARRRGTPDSIAERLGKSKRYVFDRLALAGCVEEVRVAVKAGTCSIKAAKQFARLQANDQLELLESIGTDFDTSRVAAAADAFSRKLTKAIFTTSDDKLVPAAGSCLDCPKRSGRNTLFADIDASDVCYDSACYQAKTDAQIERIIEETKQLPNCERVIKISDTSHHDDMPGRNDYEIDVQSNTYGVICFEAIFSKDNKIGRVLRITLDEEYENKDEVEDDDEDDDTSADHHTDDDDAADNDDDTDDDEEDGHHTSVGRTAPGLNALLAGKTEKRIDRVEQLSFMLIDLAFAGFKNGDIKLPIKTLACLALDRFNVGCREKILSLLDIPIPEDRYLSDEDIMVLVDVIFDAHGDEFSAHLIATLLIVAEMADYQFDKREMSEKPATNLNVRGMDESGLPWRETVAKFCAEHNYMQ
jgi:ParB/RepB/Spo0J family partition protein